MAVASPFPRRCCVPSSLNSGAAPVVCDENDGDVFPRLPAHDSSALIFTCFWYKKKQRFCSIHTKIIQIYISFAILSIDLYLQYLYWCTVEYEIKDKSKWLFDDKYYLIVHGWILMYRKSKKWISPFFSILPNTVILQYSKRDYGGSTPRVGC